MTSLVLYERAPTPTKHTGLTVLGTRMRRPPQKQTKTQTGPCKHTRAASYLPKATLSHIPGAAPEMQPRTLAMAVLKGGLLCE